MVRPGGVLVLTIKESLWEKAFAASISKSVTDGTVRLLESTAPYLSMPGDALATPSSAVVLARG